MIINKNIRGTLKICRFSACISQYKNKAIAIAATTAICASKSLMNPKIPMPLLHLLELP